jgi:hypothetical protein
MTNMTEMPTDTIETMMMTMCLMKNNERDPSPEMSENDSVTDSIAIA